MDLNEQHGAALTAAALQTAAPSVPVDDPLAMAVIAEARANNLRDKARQFMDEAEVFKILNVTSTADAVFTLLQGLGFRSMGVQVVAGSRWTGRPDTGELIFERRVWDAWLQNFETIASHLGFVKTQKRR